MCYSVLVFSLRLKFAGSFLPGAYVVGNEAVDRQKKYLL